MTKYPLIFVPGILGSTIQAHKVSALSIGTDIFNKISGKNYTDGADGWWNAWPATAESWLEMMEFSSPSTPKYQSRCLGLLEKANAGPEFAVQDVYILTINHLCSLGYEKDKDLFLYAYDFRYDLDLIANSPQNISEGKSLSSFIEEVKQKTSSSKVNLICHSMGGLVALNYLIIQPDRIENVDRIVLLGTPVFGSAKAFAGLSCGLPPDQMYDWLAGVWTPTRLKWKVISRFFTAPYQLIPSRPLVEGMDSFVSIFNQDQNYEQSHGINNSDLINHDTLLSKELLRRSFNWKEHFIDALKNNWNTFSSCLYFIQGNRVPTPIKYSIHYPINANITDWRLAVDNNMTTSEDGDGTVLNYGLREFLGVDPQKIHHFDDVKHLDLATNSEVLTCAVGLLTSESI